MKKFFFARLHFSGLFGPKFAAPNLFRDLQELEKQDGFIEAESYGWYFRNIKEEEIESKKYITGILQKVSLIKDEIVVDEKTKQEKVETINNVKTKESFFIIYPEKNIIAFESYKLLCKKQFFAAFIEGYKKIKVNYEPEFDLVFDESRLLEELKKLTIAGYARFILKTTNPDARKEFEKIDNLFRATNSEENRLYLKPKKGDSLNFKNADSLVRQGLAMSASGYGSGEVSGKDIQGNPHSIKTGENNLKSVEIHESKTDKEVKRSIIIQFNKLNQ